MLFSLSYCFRLSANSSSDQCDFAVIVVSSATLFFQKLSFLEHSFAAEDKLNTIFCRALKIQEQHEIKLVNNINNLSLVILFIFILIHPKLFILYASEPAAASLVGSTGAPHNHESLLTKCLQGFVPTCKLFRI